MPPLCTGEKHDQDENRQGHHIVLKRRRRELETFDGGEYRNRRCDHGIANEHRSTDDAERQQWPAPPAQRTLTQRHQRKRAALAVIVGAQQQQDVFRGDDDKKRPQDQRQNPEHDGSGYRLALRGTGDSLTKRIQRRCSDIAKDYTDASQRQCPKTGRYRSLMGFG